MTAISTFAPYIEPPKDAPPKAIYEQFKILPDDGEFRFRLPNVAVPGRHTFSKWLRYEDGEFIISIGYTWDGNTPKLRIGPFVFGTSDGPLIPGTNEPMGKIPSLGHDVVYEHIWAIAEALGLSVWAVRAAADRWFYERWLVAGQMESEARRYYKAVRCVGWINVLRRKLL